MAKITKEKFKTYKNVFDEHTLRILFKLASQGHFDELTGPVSIGKESNVFSARKGNKKIIVKIYRLETCDFNRMYDYIKFDPRFENLKKSKRKIIFAWTQREYRNLIKSREAGVKVPVPLAFSHNVLLLEFIGDKDPAPKLKDNHPDNPKNYFDETICNMQKLHNAGLVHADLSPFNILNYREKPVFIDFSQATSKEDPLFDEYLERDIRNICIFFRKTGLDIKESDVLKKVKYNNKV